jgi:hypothetical protein
LIGTATYHFKHKILSESVAYHGFGTMLKFLGLFFEAEALPCGF